jgi:imidazolonepropionase-like amidohydrolase
MSMSFRKSAEPERWTLVRGARQLLTLHHKCGPCRAGELENLGAIPDGSVLLRNDVIEAVGPTRRVENLAQARDAEEINAAGCVVMPAFIDAHACPIPGAVQNIPATRVEAQADELLKILARHGTASLGAVTGYATDTSVELKMLRALHALESRPLDLISILAVRETARARGFPALRQGSQTGRNGSGAMRRRGRLPGGGRSIFVPGADARLGDSLGNGTAT